MLSILIRLIRRVGLGLLPLLPLLAHAQTPLTMEQAMRLAIERQPLLQSYDHAASAAREAAVAEGQLPDPRIRFGVQNAPITGADAYRLNRIDMTMSSVGIMQEVVRSEKRDAAAQRMRVEASQIESEKSASASSIRRDTALAWLDAYEAQRKVDSYRAMATEMAAERQVALSRLASGGATDEIFKLDTMQSMTNDKRLSAERDARKARAMLARWIGAAAHTPLAESLPALAPPATRQASLINQHPQLEAARRAEQVVQAEIDRAKVDHLPNWGWEVMYGQRQGDRSDLLSVQISMDLPWDRAQRQDRRTAEKLALAERARHLTQDKSRELSAELESAWADWDAAQARLAEHDQRLLPAAKARLATAQAAYTGGNAALSNVWDARRGALDAALEHWIILVDQQRAAVRLAYLTQNTQEMQP